MDNNESFIYYEVDDDHYFKIAHLNELLTGQDKVQTQGIWSSHAKEFPVQLDNLYLCVGGLPRRLYRQFYHCSASRYMGIFNEIKQKTCAFLAEWGCRGEICLFNYGQKQIVLLYSPVGEASPDPHLIASQFGHHILDIYKDRLYEGQEPIWPFTVYSGRIVEYEEIAPTFQRMLTLHDLNFFVNEPRVIFVDDPHFQQNHVRYNDLLLILDLLKQCAADRDEAMAETCIRDLCARVRTSLREDYLQDILHEIKSLMFKVARTYGCREDTIRTSCSREGYPTLQALTEALCLQMRQLLTEAKSQPKINPITQRALRHIQIHYREDITLPLLAKIAHAAPNYLSRVFNQDMGMSIPVYLNQIRMENAARLLEDEELRISDVAFQVGFSDPHHFTRLFKKQFGRTPSEYRKSLRDAL